MILATIVFNFDLIGGLWFQIQSFFFWDAVSDMLLPSVASEDPHHHWFIPPEPWTIL